MMKFFTVFFLLLMFCFYSFADEGMWPITEIDKLDLPSKGLVIPVQQIYNPEGVSLMHAILNLSGCTGSFVSEKGLIITNHHCAFGAVQRASTVENDYLTDGFLAKDFAEELPAPGYTASIMEFYKDVSAEVLSAVNDQMNFAERSKAIDKKKKEILLAAEKTYPEKRASIAEMFIGKTYLLFIYTRLKDVRMVYIPPLAVGEFGGETDNWIWPRHTGDFSFFRAYVAPDGSPADYSPENVPYQPKTHFQVAAQGVDEEDFVFIMGYPGRTYRHRTSYYMDYEENVRMPFLADWYEHVIRTMEKFSEKDPQAALKLASPIKGYANRMKNYRGKLLGMERLDLTEKRRQEEENLQRFIESKEAFEQQYGTLLNDIKKLYQERGATAKRSLILDNIIYISTLLTNARTVYQAADNKQKPDVERESAYMDRNIERTKRRAFLRLKSYYAPSQKVLLKDILQKAMDLPAGQRIKGIDSLFKAIRPDDYVNQLYEQSRFADETYLKEMFSKDIKEIKQSDDPAIRMILALNKELKAKKESGREFSGALNKLHAQLIDIKKEFYGQEFIPDANGTFRLTYGYIRGYSPRDAVYYSPITTFEGVLEKTTGESPFITPPDLVKIYKDRQFGQFYNPKLKSVPVAILYNTDTTGGNSGSPVLNAKGELVGVNFDRAWEATINDYAWNEDYSRSIAVDIRYVLWVTQQFGGADHLLEEMNIQ